MAGVRRMLHSRRVSGRASKLVFAAGFVAVLALGIGLVVLTHGATQAAAPPAAHDPVAPESPVADAPAAHAPPIGAREHHALPAAPRSPGAPPAQPRLGPAPVSFTRELKRDADGHLVPMIPLQELRGELHQADAATRACVERSGQHVTGGAMLSFTIAASHNKLVIDNTGVQDEETLAGHPELLACLHQAANTVVLSERAVPELGTPIYVRRHVRIENGVLAEDWVYNFSYNP
jgi:hypothetical protein